MKRIFDGYQRMPKNDIRSLRPGHTSAAYPRIGQRMINE